MKRIVPALVRLLLANPVLFSSEDVSGAPIPSTLHEAR